MVFKKILLLLPIALLFAFLICTYLTKGSCFPRQEDNKKDTVIDTSIQNQFRLEGKYIKDNTWNYTITGQLPNPCYNVDIDEVIKESYPEQVTVLVAISPPQEDIVCVQVIEEFFYEGTFNASEKATVNLQVE